jgi:TonB family protein
LRRASARTLSVLYWAGVLKLMLPLPLLGPVSDRLLQSLTGALAAAPAEAGWTGVTVLMYPVLLDSGSPGWVGPPPAVWLALTSAWILGAALILVRRLRSGWVRGRLASGDQDGLSDELRLAVADAELPSDAVHVRRESPGPFVKGSLRPVIVLPAAIVEQLDRDELRAVLIHEREHLRRRDPLRYAVLAAVRAAFWYYPPVWWLVRRIRETTEMACDEAVVRAGVPGSTYCRSLARMLSLGLAHGPAASPVGILGRRPSFLRRRLERIRSGRRSDSMNSHRLIVAAAAVAAVILSLLPFTPAPSLRAQDEPVTLNFQQAPVGRIFEALEATSGIDFHVQGDLADKAVSIEIPRTPLKLALVQLGLVAGATYRVLGPYLVHVEPVAVAVAGMKGVTLPTLIPESKAKPVYPEKARKNGVEGTVILQALIDRTGAVVSVEMLSTQPKDHPEFGESAMAAIRKWRYEPATHEGEPVDVYFTVRVNFALGDSPKNL